VNAVCPCLFISPDSLSTLLENTRLDLAAKLEENRVEQKSLVDELSRLQLEMGTSNESLLVKDGLIRDLETRILDLQVRFDAGVAEMAKVKEELVNMSQAGEDSSQEILRVRSDLDQQIALVVARDESLLTAGDNEFILMEHVSILEGRLEGLGTRLSEAEKRYDGVMLESGERMQTLGIRY
jgi:chromosome segregation ATPase